MKLLVLGVHGRRLVLGIKVPSEAGSVPFGRTAVHYEGPPLDRDGAPTWALRVEDGQEVRRARRRLLTCKWSKGKDLLGCNEELYPHRIMEKKGVLWSASAVVRASVSLGFLVATGCGAAGSASLMLRAPVTQQCQQVPLQGCDELSEGVLLYLSGEKEEGRAKLVQGAAKNAPADLQKYASTLRALEQMPGAQKFMQPLGEVTAILTRASTLPKGGPDISPQPVSVAEAPKSDVARTPSGPSAFQGARLLTADTDVARMRFGTLASPSESHAWCNHVAESARCELVRRGTLVLTDLVSVGSRCEGQYMAVIRGGIVQLRLEGPFDFHGARVVIPASDALVVGQRLAPEQPHVPAKKGAAQASSAATSPASSYDCGFYYSGYVPYEATTETPPRTKDLD